LTFAYFRGTLFYLEAKMETQNITLSLPKELLLKVKLMAVERGTSVSGFLTQTLVKLVEQEEAYVHSRRRHLEWLDHGADLGTGGRLSISRKELHRGGRGGR
jgi:hypothetical protein